MGALTETERAATLRPTPYIDADHPAVSAFVRENAGDGGPRAMARRLFTAVRDAIRYDPYCAIDVSEEAFRARFRR